MSGILSTYKNENYIYCIAAPVTQPATAMQFFLMVREIELHGAAVIL